jgi:hypothetical protein
MRPPVPYRERTRLWLWSIAFIGMMVAGRLRRGDLLSNDARVINTLSPLVGDFRMSPLNFTGGSVLGCKSNFAVSNGL